MNDTIICPNCKKPIPLTEALSHQIQERYQKFYKQRLNEEKTKIELQLKDQLTKKIKEDIQLELKDKSNELEELKNQNKLLQDQLLEINKSVRQLRFESQQKQIELEKKLVKEQEKIRIQEMRRVDEEYRFKILEKDKQMNDMRKQIEELKRKSEQGSQQLQGEVLELELEEILKKDFPYDEVKPVPKGTTGADVLQIVKNNFGKVCGTIIWESKRTKAWTDNWISKLKQDQRQVKAEVAVIISQTLPEGLKYFSQKNGVWIGNFGSIEGLGLLLRNSLIELASVKSSIIGKQEKKEILWNYLTSTEFRQRIEAMYDAYQQTKTILDKEKEFFRRKWAREEKHVQLLMENLLGIHGDLQAIIGKSLPEIKGLDMLPSGSKDELF